MNKIYTFGPKGVINGPKSRLIREGTTGDCPECGSTTLLKHEWFFVRWGDKIGCIQPSCENYYDSEQNKRERKLEKLGI